VSLIRIRAAEVLGAIIAGYYPEIADSICGGPAEDGHKRRLPSIAIQPINWKFTPDQESEWKELGLNRVVLNAGRYDAFFRVQVGSKSPYVRAKLEQAVLDTFFQQEGRPGITVVEIADCNDAIVAYELEQSSWQDEAGFSDKWFSTINVNVVMPVLIERGSVFSMDEIRFCLRADTAASFDTISESVLECIAVDENGNVTLSTLPT